MADELPPLDAVPPMPEPTVPTPPAVEEIPPFARRDLPPPRPPHPGFFMAILWCILFLIITQVLPSIPAAIYGIVSVLAEQQGGQLNQMDLQEIMRRTILPAMVLAQVASIAFSLLVLRLVVGPDWTRQIALRRPAPGHVLLTILVFPAIAVLANFAYALLKEILPSVAQLTKVQGMPGMEEMVSVFAEWPLPLAVLVIGVGPGIGEELWCRGFLGRGLLGKYGVVAGVLLTSFFFGAIHIDPPQGSMAALMGIALHYLYLTSRSLWLPMLLHFLNNSLAMVGTKVEALNKLDRPPVESSLALFISAALLTIAVGWALYRSRARLADTGDAWPWTPPYPGVAHPPTESSTIVMHPPVGAAHWSAVAIAAAMFAGACFTTLRA